MWYLAAFLIGLLGGFFIGGWFWVFLALKKLNEHLRKYH